MADLQLVRVAPETLSSTQARQISELLYQAATQFYDLVPLPRDELLDAIAKQIGDPGTEFADTYVDFDGDDPRAAVAIVDAPLLDKVKAAGVARFVRRLPAAARPEFFRALSTYGKEVAPVTGSGRYIARITVADAARGQGLGAAIIREVQNLAGDLPVLLHVHKDNRAAIQLYRKLGFEKMSDEGFAFGLWQLRKTGPSSQNSRIG